MGTRRITYTSALIGSALFYILYSHWFSWYLLVLLLMLVPFDFFVSLPGMLTRRVILASPDVLDQGESGILAITTLQKKSFPVRCVKLWMHESGDGFSSWKRYMCGADRGSRYQIEIDTARSGLTVFEIKRIWAVSLIGLFSIPTTVNCRAAVLVLPAPLKPSNVVALPRGVILRPKPGGGFSEDYDLRRYRQGDPIKSIHWKISAKLDSLIIREPLIPPSHSRLIHITQWDGAHARDLILGHLRWVSDYLLKWELPYYVRLGEDEPVVEITGADALADYLYRVLDGKPETLTVPSSLPARFAWVYRVEAGEARA